MKHKLYTAAALTLSFSLLLGGCGSFAPGKAAETESEMSSADPTQMQADFDDFTDSLFAEAVSTDALSLHYQLADPSQYGIELDAVDFGTFNASYDASAEETEKEEYDTLLSFDYASLTEDQQVTYDLLEEYYKTSAETDYEDFFYYQEPLGLSSGQHTLLPVLMAEYAFYDREDVENYLQLLDAFPSYFDQILAFEQAKSKAGLFMSDAQADTVMESCKTFISDPESNPLIEVFPEKLKDLPDLSDQEILDYTERNQKAVLESVVPAYQTLHDGISALKGTGSNDLGLSYFEKGKDYYASLAAEESGTGLSPEELIDLIDTAMEDDMNAIADIIKKEPLVYYSWMEGPEPDTDDPAEMIAALQKAIKEEFPPAYTEDYKLRYVPESLEESMNPAFYLQPPVDLPDQNVIYLNKSKIQDDKLYLFTTLAHEGFPGHLYQITYYGSKESSPLRKVMNYPAYAEGWATYVEGMANKWIGVNKKLAEVLMLNNQLTICLYARVDLGVHYEGWDTEDVMTYLSDYGIGDEATAKELLSYVIGDPAGYLPYAVGGMEFSNLAKEAAAFAGESFSLKEFHQYILDIGPCSFTVLRKHMAEDGLLPVSGQQAASAR